MAQNVAMAIYFIPVGQNRACREKRYLEQPLGFVTDIYIYQSWVLEISLLEITGYPTLFRNWLGDPCHFCEG